MRSGSRAEPKRVRGFVAHLLLLYRWAKIDPIIELAESDAVVGQRRAGGNCWMFLLSCP